MAMSPFRRALLVMGVLWTAGRLRGPGIIADSEGEYVEVFAMCKLHLLVGRVLGVSDLASNTPLCFRSRPRNVAVVAPKSPPAPSSTIMTG